LFTKHLLANLSSPGLDALQVFQNVGRGVYAESGGKQKPWISASVMPRAFQFVRGPATGSTAPLPTPPVESPAQVTVIDTPPEVAVSNTAVTDNRGNVGRVPKPNIVLLLVAEDASSAAWLLELARDRIYKWYGGDPSGTDITLHVEYMSFSDAKARSMLEKKFRIKRDDLPAMLSAVKVNSNFEGSLAMQRRVKESTDLGPFFNTLFQPKAP
jgi:hypothetical protein